MRKGLRRWATPDATAAPRDRAWYLQAAASHALLVIAGEGALFFGGMAAIARLHNHLPRGRLVLSLRSAPALSLRCNRRGAKAGVG